MKKVIHFESGIETDDYIGKWYDGDVYPQSVYLNINKDRAWIDTREPNGGYSPAEWHKRVLLYHIAEGSCVVSQKEAEELLEELADKIKLLQESYTERCDGCNYWGQWDDSLVDDLECVIQSMDGRRFEHCFDDE